MVFPCLPTCEPVQCDVMDFGGQIKTEESYGRKKREALPFVIEFGGSEPSYLETAMSPVEQVKQTLNTNNTICNI